MEGRKLNSKNKLTIFPYRFSFSLYPQNNHQQDMARTPTCTSTGWGTCRSRCREAGGERERCWAFSDFFLCFSCLIRITDDPTAQNTFQSLYILFFVHACCARACAPFALLSECVARAPRSARFNFVPPLKLFSFPLTTPAASRPSPFSSPPPRQNVKTRMSSSYVPFKVVGRVSRVSFEVERGVASKKKKKRGAGVSRSGSRARAEKKTKDRMLSR